MTEIIRNLEKDSKSYFLSVFVNQTRKRSLKQSHKVWKDEYHPIGLKSGPWFAQKLQYMHNNPVRKGFVEFPENWKYSSARNWSYNDHSIIKITKLDVVFSIGAEAP